MSRQLHVEITADHTLIWTIDQPRARANLLTRNFLEVLDEEVMRAEGLSHAKGLVIRSGKPGIFLAGADLKALAHTPPADLGPLVALGQRVFSRLSNLPFPKVCAIHGACLGGGYELALACDWRIGTEHRRTKVGLPEVGLGLLPAWGGCTRLPRLVGFLRAVEIILGGKSYNHRKALGLGLLDATVYPEELVDAALSCLGRGCRRSSFHIANLPPLPHLLAWKMQGQLRRRLHGNLPAVPAALKVIRDSLALPQSVSFSQERKAFVGLAATPVHDNLVRLHFLREKAVRGPCIRTRRTLPPIRNVMVLGAGVMGAGIVQWLSSRGMRVVLKELYPDRLACGMAGIRSSYRRAVDRKVMTPLEASQGLDRITPVTTRASLRNTDLVIEAIAEDLPTKQAVLGQLEDQAPEHTLFASNTSALSVQAIGKGFHDPSRLLGLHFFNPVHRMPLMELVKSESTSRMSLARALQFVRRIGKVPIQVRDQPGFLVNRILIPSMLEALHLFQEGESVGAIDSLMLRYGMPMGPLRLIDEVGVDVARKVSQQLVNHLSGMNSLPGTLSHMESEGMLGRKSGLGFYDYGDGPHNPVPNSGLSQLGWVSNPSIPWQEMRDRMVFCMVNEAARCLDEQITASAREIDLAMVLGAGWAPFRGGPLRYAESLGVKAVVASLRDLSRTAGPHFRPCPILEQLSWQKHPTSTNPARRRSSPAVLHQP